MSWRMAPMRARMTTTIQPGVEVRVSDPEMPRQRAGEFPQMFVHQVGQEVPEIGIVPAQNSSSADLEHLAEMARTWAERLEEAARWRRDQEDSVPYRDAG